MSYQIKLPLVKSSEQGMEHINNPISSVVQDFKNLLLTTPFEKISDPNFGVGLPQYLFEYPTEDKKNQIRQNIIEKTSIYIPFLKINNISFSTYEEKLLLSIDFYVGSENNQNQIKLSFDVDPLQTNSDPVSD
jgi:phage baseplate assembly protein W